MWKDRFESLINNSHVNPWSAIQIHNSMLPAPPIIPDTIEKLLQLARLCSKCMYRDCWLMPNISTWVEKLNDLVGQNTLKQRIVDIIINLSQTKQIDPMIFHTVIHGPSGVGKSTVVHIVSNIMANVMSLVYSTNSPKVVNVRSDSLIAQYVGQTAPRTNGAIDSAQYGVLVIDEVGSLIPYTKRETDSFVKSCIDTLNRRLSEDPKFICIIAGYSAEVVDNLLNLNDGLRRRFMNKMKLEVYSKKQLHQMFVQHMKKHHECVSLNLHDTDFDPEKFPHHGGSIYQLCNYVVQCKNIRSFGHLNKNSVDKADFDKAMTKYKANLNKKDPVKMDMYM